MFGWRVTRVDGDSMAPGLEHGDYVISQNPSLGTAPGDVLLVRHPTLGLIVKRVLRVDEAGCCVLGGDNALSMCSDTIGSITPTMIVGVVRWRVAPDGLFRLRRRCHVADLL